MNNNNNNNNNKSFIYYQYYKHYLFVKALIIYIKKELFISASEVN